MAADMEWELVQVREALHLPHLPPPPPPPGCDCDGPVCRGAGGPPWASGGQVRQVRLTGHTPGPGGGAAGFGRGR